MLLKEFALAARRTLPDLHTLYKFRGEVELQSLGFINYTQEEDNSEKILTETGDVLNLVHTRLGMCSELNEIMDALHKQDRVGVSEELADLLWYIVNDIHIACRTTIISEEEESLLLAKTFGKQLEATDGGSLAASQGIFMWLHSIIYNISCLQDTGKRFFAYGKVEREKQDYIVNITYLLNAINNFAYDYQIDLHAAMEAVIAKLKERYPKAFNSVDATNRDTDKERQILEGTIKVDSQSSIQSR